MAVDTDAIRVNWQGSTTACQQAAAEVITVLCDEVDRLRMEVKRLNRLACEHNGLGMCACCLNWSPEDWDSHDRC